MSVAQLGDSEKHPKNNFELSEEQRSRIHAEEFYRQEVRQQLETKGSWLLQFLNSPFGIYVLSSILVSGLTYLYTRHQEELESERRRTEEVLRLEDEISFRERQVTEAIHNAMAETTAVLMFSPGMHGALQTDATGYQIECEEASASVRLGGITFPPGDPVGSKSRYRDLVVDNDLLPYRQGYKSPDYKYSNFADLVLRRWKLTHHGQDPSISDVSALNAATSNLDNSAFILVRTLINVASPAGRAPAENDLVALSKIMRPLLDDLNARWQDVQMLPLLR